MPAFSIVEAEAKKIEVAKEGAQVKKGGQEVDPIKIDAIDRLSHHISERSDCSSLEHEFS